MEKRNGLFLERGSDHRNIKKLESASVAVDGRFCSQVTIFKNPCDGNHVTRAGAAGLQGRSLQSCKLGQAPVTSVRLSSLLCSGSNNCLSLCLAVGRAHSRVWGQRSFPGPVPPQREARVVNSGHQPAGVAPSSTSSKEEGGSYTTPSFHPYSSPPLPPQLVSLYL